MKALLYKQIGRLEDLITTYKNLCFNSTIAEQKALQLRRKVNDARAALKTDNPAIINDMIENLESEL